MLSFVCATTAAALEPTDVIAESSRVRITVADFEGDVANLPPALRAELAANTTRLRQYLDNVYVMRVLAADARTEGMDKDPAFVRDAAAQIDKMLAQAKVERIEAAAAAEFDANLDKYAARAREIYVTNKPRFAAPAQVRAAHILITVKNGNREAALTKVEAIRAKAVAGANFNDLAREFSEDASVVNNGGELGFFDATKIDPDFAAAAFAMIKKGEISAPILSKYGYHIILFEDRRPAGTRPFDEVKPELMADLRKKALEEARNDVTRKIFADPTLKVNAELIGRINADARTRVPDTHPVPKP
jgi:peptidyl-prolyl cis-trans isomerase C